MFEFDDVELSGPLPLLLSRTLVPGTVLSVVDASAALPAASTKTVRNAAPTANRTRISTPKTLLRANWPPPHPARCPVWDADARQLTPRNDEARTRPMGPLQ